MSSTGGEGPTGPNARLFAVRIGDAVRLREGLYAPKERGGGILGILSKQVEHGALGPRLAKIEARGRGLGEIEGKDGVIGGLGGAAAQLTGDAPSGLGHSTINGEGTVGIKVGEVARMNLPSALSVEGQRQILHHGVANGIEDGRELLGEAFKVPGSRGVFPAVGIAEHIQEVRIARFDAKGINGNAALIQSGELANDARGFRDAGGGLTVGDDHGDQRPLGIGGERKKVLKQQEKVRVAERTERLNERLGPTAGGRIKGKPPPRRREGVVAERKEAEPIANPQRAEQGRLQCLLARTQTPRLDGTGDILDEDHILRHDGQGALRPAQHVQTEITVRGIGRRFIHAERKAQAIINRAERHGRLPQRGA